MRISYTSIRQWLDGNREVALKMIAHERLEYDIERERSFAYGKGVHKAFELESQITNKLPVVFKLPTFEVLATELVLIKELPTGDKIKGVLDAVAIEQDKQIAAIVDYKSGNNCDPLQGCIYHYLCNDHPWWLENIGNVSPSHAIFCLMDKNDDTTSNTFMHLTMPRNKQEWNMSEGSTYTRGFNAIMTVLEEIKSEYPEFVKNLEAVDKPVAK